MNLPDLNIYRNSFVNKGVKLPLKTIPADAGGMLEKLPPPPTGKKGWPWTEETSPLIYHDHIHWPKLTIVTPSYNQGIFLEQTIRSVLLQNYPNLEYIVIDGGSTDGSGMLLEKYAPWISYWQSEKDKGQSHAINIGFSLASGDYHAWINSDDFYLQAVFDKIINTFLKTRARFVYGYVLNFHVQQQKLELIQTIPLVDYFNRIPTLMQAACFWSASIHQPIWEELHCALDYELWLRMIKGQKRKLITEPLAVAQVHEQAKTHNPLMAQMWASDHRLICSNEAHGQVNHWDTMIRVYRIYNKVIVLYRKIAGLFARKNITAISGR